MIALLLLLFSVSTSLAVEPALELKPVDSRQFFIDPGTEVAMRWTGEGLTAGQEIPVQIFRYDGALESSQNIKMQDGAVVLRIRLREGFYTIVFPEKKQAFGLLVQPAFGGERDEFFGMDAGLSWIYDQSLRTDFIAIMNRIGLTIARERLSWPQIEPTEGGWDWETSKKYDETRRLYGQSKLKILEMFQSAPAWTFTATPDRPAPTENPTTYQIGPFFPNNLIACRKAWLDIADRWTPYWDGLEVWNEADVNAGRLGLAERYIPLAKTIKYAFQSAHNPTPVGGGVFGYFTRSYMDLAAENGLLDAVDFLSFHYYREPFQLENLISEYRAYLKNYGRESLPLWMTEVGGPWKGTPHTRPNQETDQNTALKYAQQTIEARACGIVRYFPFYLPDFTERGTNNFGMLDQVLSPLRSFASYAQVVRALSGTEYIGDIDLGNKKLRCRVFLGKNETAILVVEAPETGQYTTEVPFPVISIEGIDGRKVESKGGILFVSDGVAYIRVKKATIAKLINSNTTAMQLRRLAAVPSPTRPLSPIVLQISMDTRTFSYGGKGYEIPDAATSLPVTVRVTNLSDKPREIRLSVGADSAGKRANPSVQPVTVSADSFIDVTSTVEASSVHYSGAGIGSIRATAEGKGAGNILPAVLRISKVLGLEDSLKPYSYRFPLPITELGRWKKNSSGQMEFSKSESGHFKYDVAFNPDTHDRWAYPRFTFPQEVDQDRVTGVLVRARCEKEAVVRIMTWKGDENIYNLTGYSIIPADGKWHVALIQFSDLILLLDKNQKIGRQVRDISVGFGPSRSGQNGIEVSDLILVGN